MRLIIEQDWHVGDVVEINHAKYEGTKTITKCGYDGFAKEWLYYYINDEGEEEWTTRHFIITEVTIQSKAKLYAEHCMVKLLTTYPDGKGGMGQISSYDLHRIKQILYKDE